MVQFSDEDETTENGDNEKQAPKSLMEKMMGTRTILIYGEINQKIAREVTERLLLLSAESDEDIKLFINSQGGHVESGYTIFDMIRFVNNRVKIIGTGWAASAGALIYAAVPKSDRFSLPHTRYMLHQPMGGVRGQAADIAIEAEEIMKMRENLNKLFSEQTGQPLDRVREDTDRNFWMSAQEALNYGLVGKVVYSAAELDEL